MRRPAVPAPARAALGLGAALLLALVAPSAAPALDPAAAYTLRDGPVPDGLADDILLPPDPNFGRVFQSELFDAEFYLEFPVPPGESADEVWLSLAIDVTGVDLVRGESKTFNLSHYQGDGIPSLATFGSGLPFETVVLPDNLGRVLDLDVTDLWNAAVARGDDFFGVRMHDPVWTGTTEGAGTITYDSALLVGVPEPSGALCAVAALGALAGLGGRCRRPRPSQAPGARLPDASLAVRRRRQARATRRSARSSRGARRSATSRSSR